MKKTLKITATLYDPTLLKNLVERLASKHIDKGFTKAVIPCNWQPIENCSTTAYVMGNIDLNAGNGDVNKKISMPFTTRFLFTCIKEKYGLFNLEWSSSLS